tara:strand:+ start:7888 stop:8109 length:222 start_codon:yes stop_codon:yes gene_type:complete
LEEEENSMSDAEERDYTWLVFLYNRAIVDNILTALDSDVNKYTGIRVPKRYQVVYEDVAKHYNEYWKEKKEEE